MVIDVELVDRCTPEIVEVFCRDEPRLSSRPSRLKPEVLADMIASPAYQLLVARIDGVLSATLTLAVYRAPRGIKANVGDVVAEQTEPGQSAAAALVEEAVRRAAVGGAAYVTLVSKPRAGRREQHVRTTGIRTARARTLPSRDTKVIDRPTASFPCGPDRR